MRASASIRVHYDADNRSTFALGLELRPGEVEWLQRDHPQVVAVEELAFARLLDERPGPLPSGSFAVVIACDDDRLPSVQDLGAAVARRALEAL